jgi:DNA-nicking Smr family endonuclease
VAKLSNSPLLRRIEPTFGMEPEEYPIDGVLDLHVFDPSEVGDLVPEYLRACREKDILRVRIIHGKGTGQLRRSVHAILDRLDTVTSYETAKDASSWGATIVYLEGDA